MARVSEKAALVARQLVLFQKASESFISELSHLCGGAPKLGPTIFLDKKDIEPWYNTHAIGYIVRDLSQLPGLLSANKDDETKILVSE